MTWPAARRILVTGATGFIGRPLVRALAASGHDVHGAARSGRLGGGRLHCVDLLDAEAVADLMDEVRPTDLVHLAWTTTHGHFWRDPANLDWAGATLSLLRTFHRGGGRRALLTGSCAEYDWSTPGPYREPAAGPPPETLYGATKLATGLTAVAFGRQTGLEVAWARLFHLYGPGEPAQRLVPQLLHAAARGTHVELDNPGSVIDLMHVDDAAAALAAVLESGVTGPVNVATGLPVPLASVAGTVADLAGLDRPAPHGAAASGRLIHADTDRLEREVGVPPPRGLDEGLGGLWDLTRSRIKETETV